MPRPDILKYLACGALIPSRAVARPGMNPRATSSHPVNAVPGDKDGRQHDSTLIHPRA